MPVKIYASQSDYRRVNILRITVRLPDVPFKAASAPVRDNKPPGFKNCDPIVAEMVDDQTLCRHIKSAFLAKSFDALPPAQPPKISAIFI